MDEKDYEIKECFAYFGRAVYMAQVVEKGILNSLLINYNNITKTRFDELLAEKSQLTLGQLKREITEKGIFDEKLIEEIERFQAKRDWLIHNYWWERSVEFNRDDLRYKIFEELEELTIEFEELERLINVGVESVLVKNGLNPEKLVEEFASLEQTPDLSLFRKLSKNETLIGVYLYKSNLSHSIPIFKLADDTYWTLCEIGLTPFESINNESELKPLEKTNGIFPVLQFNPRPKIIQDWEYDLDLKKNGMYVQVKPMEINGNFSVNWTIKKRII